MSFFAGFYLLFFSLFVSLVYSALVMRAYDISLFAIVRSFICNVLMSVVISIKNTKRVDKLNYVFVFYLTSSNELVGEK